MKEFIPQLSLKKNKKRRPNYSSVERKRTPPSLYYFFFVLQCVSQLCLLASFVAQIAWKKKKKTEKREKFKSSSIVCVGWMEGVYKYLLGGEDLLRGWLG